MIRLKKIISGGQTGADQGALAAAKELGIPTGGFAPAGFRTDDGYKPSLEKEYGLQATASSTYQRRTVMNVEWCDATLIFGNPKSTGSKLTLNTCVRYKRPWLVVHWAPGRELPAVELFRTFLSLKSDLILNVAGNRERSAPGIYDACKAFLILTLKGK